MAAEDPAAVWARAATNAPNTSVHGPLPFVGASIPTSLQDLAYQLGTAFRAIVEAGLRQVALALGAVEIFGWSPYEALVEIGDEIIAATDNFNSLLAAFGLPTMDAVAAAMVTASNNALAAVNDLGGFLVSTGQASLSALGSALASLITFLTSIPASLISGVTPDWLAALSRVGATTPTHFVNSLQGLVSAAQRDVGGTLSVIGDGVANFVDNANGTWSFILQQGEADVANLIQGADGAIYTAAQISQQAVAAANAAGVGVGQAVASGQQAVDHAIAAIGGLAVQAGQSAQALGAAWTGSFTSWANSWTNGAAAAANAADVASAAAAAYAAARQQKLQTDAINALTPNFYGGRGTSGLTLQSVTWSGTLPSSFTLASTIATDSAVYNVATASTDEETVSVFWNTPLSSLVVPGEEGPARYLFLRGNTGLTTYLYAKHWVDLTGSYLIIRVEIGCVVGGIQQPAFATDSIALDSYAAMGLLYGPQGWALQVTGNAISVDGPGSYRLSTTDGPPGDPPVVSQFGSGYRRAGVGSDETSWLTTIADWNFYDSGPTAGPVRVDVATEESTDSDTFVDLDTTHQVAANIGSNGLALVFLSADVSNNGFISDMSYELSGENTRAATSSPIVRYNNPGNTLFATVNLSYLETGLYEGPTNFTVKHRDDPDGGPYTSTFKNRHLSVIPL